MNYLTTDFERTSLKTIILEQARRNSDNTNEKCLTRLIQDYKKLKKRIFNVEIVIGVQFAVFLIILPLLFAYLSNEYDIAWLFIFAVASFIYAFYSHILSRDASLNDRKMVEAYIELIEEYTERLRNGK